MRCDWATALRHRYLLRAGPLDLRPLAGRFGLRVLANFLEPVGGKPLGGAARAALTGHSPFNHAK
ncbi:hypothetical protein M8542_00085 [Amycolatopsis sp. OK19-0408]|uniref:Uncharacterized protein n=1 Tax=Amycolatopsis iheyensis TaxID=2945988 RepID=A0A9X2SFZ3_9PSEU|nr:hypothetical protein [Amycolatopsis iheyensis]MCR6481207.1 hypothetical protein [Amycolatopsis iheyensis]